MKTAYELAMERLNRSAPPVKLTDDQKKKLAELDSLYTAKLAERDLFLKGEMAKAEAEGNIEVFEQLNRQWSNDRRNLQAELEQKKDQVRQEKPAG
jgi:hypothetical protein